MKKVAKNTRKALVKKTVKKAVARKASDSARGRVSALAKKKLFPTDATKEVNPRRKATHGFKSLEIIRKHPGITYPEFVASGGRPKDVHWDIEHRNAVAR